MEGYKNPFNVTKAVDFSDEEIIRYWVDFEDDIYYKKIIKPDLDMPMLLLGGKGSGKTHMMRYCSFELQKIRGGVNYLKDIKLDRYIGVYLRCSGLNSNRFIGKGQDDDVWKSIFAYYIELWFAELLINIIIDLKCECDIQINEKGLCGAFYNLFDKKTSVELVEDVFAIRDYVVSLRRKVDYVTNNAALKGGVTEIDVLVSPGGLVYELPKIIQKYVRDLENVRFLYLVDELENLTAEQQRYYNTLLRERRGPSTFRIGARLYGIKTKMTYASNEENKEGSEYEVYCMDDNFRKNKDAYKKFAYKICAKRLSESGYICQDELIYDVVKDKIESMFEKLDEEAYCRVLVEGKTTRPYMSRLKSKMQCIKYVQVDKIIDNLKHDNPIIEATNIFLFYRGWSDKKAVIDAYVLYDISVYVRSECNKYDLKEGGSAHEKVLDKFKSDIISKIKYECGGRYYYSGFDAFVDMSEGIPRVLLNILKHVFRWSDFYGERPFMGSKISLEAQNNGIKEASEWFFKDAIPSGNGAEVRLAIERLCQFIREIRYSDIPPECSLVAFNIDIYSLDEKVVNMLELAKQYSVLIEIKPRREKNSARYNLQLKINGILATKWDLPIYKRGDITLKVKEIESIFSSGGDAFDGALKSRVQSYNAPFLIEKNINNEDQQKLFE